MFDKNTIGANINRLRCESGMSQSALADKLGVSHQAVSQWERGETVPDVILLPEIATVFDTDVNELFGMSAKIASCKKGNALSFGKKKLRIDGDYTVQTRIEGGIRLTGDLAVLGDVNGDIDAGGDVSVHGKVNGSINAGGDATVNGKVDGSIEVGGDATVNGTIGGSIETGGDLSVMGNVAGNISAKGDAQLGSRDNSVKISGSVNVGGDAVIWADIAGDLTVDGDLELHGTVGGKIICGGEITYEEGK